MDDRFGESGQASALMNKYGLDAAGIVNRVADLTIYVLRETKVDRRYLPELERLHQEKIFNHLCIVVNDSRTRNKKYGYGYGYGYGNKEQKSFWKKLFARK